MIPKQIFQTWETKNLEPAFQKIVDSWKTMNPDYTYHLYDKNEREEFLKNNFDKSIYDAYSKIIPGAYKADLWRYCILYIYGGVYVDIDSLCMGNLDTFIENQEMVFMIDLNINEIDGKYNVANGFIAIASGSSIMLECINRITKHVNEKIITPGKLNFSGPGLLGKCINHYLGLPETSSFVNKEGKYGTLTFLKFEFGTEYVKNNNEDILFQNKNGNEEIIRLYEHECNKVKSVFWATAKQIIN